MNMSLEGKSLAPVKVHFLSLYNADQILEYWAALSLSLLAIIGVLLITVALFILYLSVTLFER